MRRVLVVFALVLPACAGALDLREKPFDVSVAVGAALPGVVQASWFEDFDPGSTVSFTTQLSPVARVSLTWWPFPGLTWIAPTVSAHYAALLVSSPVDLGFWDGRDHVIPDDGIHFLEVEAGVRSRFFLSDSLTLDPAVSLGYCATFSSSPDARNRGMTLGVAADARWWRGGWQPLATIGLMMQLFGGVTDIAYVRSYPVVYAAVGAGF
jgi:hypothetical protein